MKNFTNEMKRILLNIEKQRIILSYALTNNEITEEDILSLNNVDSNFGFSENNQSVSYKNRLLKNIYNSPFLLCDQDFLSENVKKILPAFLEYRYNMEIEELNYYYKQGQCSKEEIAKEKDFINLIYYRSSKDGKSILKTGYVRNINDDVIKCK